jgi:hypothetical protein
MSESRLGTDQIQSLMETTKHHFQRAQALGRSIDLTRENEVMDLKLQVPFSAGSLLVFPSNFLHRTYFISATELVEDPTRGRVAGYLFWSDSESAHSTPPTGHLQTTKEPDDMLRTNLGVCWREMMQEPHSPAPTTTPFRFRDFGR